jgi:hypothetical protein
MLTKDVNFNNEWLAAVPDAPIYSTRYVLNEMLYVSVTHLIPSFHNTSSTLLQVPWGRQQVIQPIPNHVLHMFNWQ